MNVQDLIEHLKTFDPTLPVAYSMWSEQCALEPDDLEVVQLCLPRPDGWIANFRPDKPVTPYLLFP